jgi:hypothetical protein
VVPAFGRAAAGHELSSDVGADAGKQETEKEFFEATAGMFLDGPGHGLFLLSANDEIGDVAVGELGGDVLILGRIFKEFGLDEGLRRFRPEARGGAFFIFHQGILPGGECQIRSLGSIFLQKFCVSVVVDYE